ncbi:MAG TPA: hypothetical protein VNR39_16470 [Pseudolabrys sp.]|nr:hypothetical protein [Pseudolabrys sp.]
MPLLGQAAVAMWWTILPERRAEFGDWHSHEHFPERMSIPGFHRGSRWTSLGGDGGFFVLYELDSYDVLTSDGYLARLNAPTPWSQKMMPHHLGMVRSQCRVAASFGGGVGSALATVRLSPRAGGAEKLMRWLEGTLADLPSRVGITGAHLLLTATPHTDGPTVEQSIRGSDKTADWIVLVSGYEPDAVSEVVSRHFAASSLTDAGGQGSHSIDRYSLALAMTPQDLAPSTSG